MIKEMGMDDVLDVSLMEEEIFTIPWSKEDFIESIRDKNNLYLVAFVDGRLGGYCGYRSVLDEAYICNVAVKKEFRRKNIGKSLLTSLIARGKERGIQGFTLEVRFSNEGAIKLYEGLGFVSAGIRKDFYTKPQEDAIIMWLKDKQ